MSKVSDDKPTPMMAQYAEIKAANPDCLLFYRMGDFYELFFEDAEIASRALGIVLTKRGKHLGEDIPMCGVPIERADETLGRLIQLGHRVAVAEQLEDPAEAKKRGPKSVVQRGVVRLITAATITEETLLNPLQANLLAALTRVEDDANTRYGLAVAEISTGAFQVYDLSEQDVAAEIARLHPTELVLPDSLNAMQLQVLLQSYAGVKASIAASVADPRDAPSRLCRFFGVQTIEGFGAQSIAERTAAAVLVAYLEKTLRAHMPVLMPPHRATGSRLLEMDAATRANLEILETSRGQRVGSLLAAVDRTQSAAGGRLLAERLASPSCDLSWICDEHERVGTFVAKPDLLRALRAILARCPDLARALGRVQAERCGPRDILAISFALQCAAQINTPMLQSLQDGFADPALFKPLMDALSQVDQGLGVHIAAAFSPDAPLQRRDGGFICDGFDVALDEARLLARDSRRVIAALQTQYQDKTGIRTLRIKNNQFLGSFVEVPAKEGERLRMEDAFFIHRQTMSDAMRFTSAELIALDEKITAAASIALQREQELFDATVRLIQLQHEPLRALSIALAQLDVACSSAFYALEVQACRPVVDDSLNFVIEAGRHPVVEAALREEGKSFVPNHCLLSPRVVGENGQIRLMTGPNMGGKSTYLRQNALMVILAQAGLYVPAARAHIGLVDRLFTRVGASDDLARGRSTFMVEMVETAAILNRATQRSLVVLDEIGRGTATFDGLSIAQATVEHLHDVVGARCLFATHFHELTEMKERLVRLGLITIKVAEYKGNVVFLHEVTDGVADHSYGLQVAKLAGLPAPVIRRAQNILRTLEAQAAQAKGRSFGFDELPLFGAAPERHTLLHSPALERLAEIDPDALTPKQALDALYEIKRLCE